MRDRTTISQITDNTLKKGTWREDCVVDDNKWHYNYDEKLLKGKHYSPSIQTDKPSVAGNIDVCQSKYRADQGSADLFRTMSMLDWSFS